MRRLLAFFLFSMVILFSSSTAIAAGDKKDGKDGKDKPDRDEKPFLPFKRKSSPAPMQSLRSITQPERAASWTTTPQCSRMLGNAKHLDCR